MSIVIKKYGAASTAKTSKKHKKTIELTSDQQEALDQIIIWYNSSKREFRLGGLAGTGKTSIIPNILNYIGPATVVAPTGKAAHVLMTKGINARTIHNLIYNFKGYDEEEKLIFEKKEKMDHKPRVLIVDESSMVNLEMYNDIKSFHFIKKILWIGDHGQLEPVGDDPKILKNPDFKLENIVRQASTSNITLAAHAVRHGEGWRDYVSQTFIVNDVDEFISKLRDNKKYADSNSQLLCGLNNTRHKFNRIFREGRNEIIEKNDKIICLLNNKNIGIFNGQVFDVDFVYNISVDKPLVSIIDNKKKKKDINIHKESFYNKLPSKVEEEDKNGYFDYAYAITVHKSQGSEWDTVVVYNESWPKLDKVRWQYTAFTRAKKKLFVIEKCKSNLFKIHLIK